MTGFFVGAYAALPSLHHSWDPTAESEMMSALRAMPDVAGLELPFYGSLHRFDAAWLKRELKSSWDYVLTCIPGTMDQLKINPRQGLASEDEAGRQAALAYTKVALDSLRELNAAVGRKAVRALVVHSAPTTPHADEAVRARAFLRSLQELASSDLDGAELWVEHCDAAQPGRPPAKGFLSLGAELDALKAVQAKTKVGMLINWGRSAVETQDPEAAERHVREARAAGLLRGLIFSGTAVGDAEFGTWGDGHAPFQGSPHTDPASQRMTVDHAARCIAAAGPLAVLGLKIQTLPKHLTVSQRLAMVRFGLDALVKAGRPRT